MAQREGNSEGSVVVVLARHGETALNAAGRFRGREDPPLTEAGERQARALGQTLSERPSIQGGFAALYASPRRRALATSSFVGRALGLDPTIVRELDDFDYGTWAGRDEAEVERAWPALHSQWRTDPVDMAFPGGETFGHAASRMAAFLRLALQRHAGTAVLAVTHDAMIRCAVCQTLSAPLVAFHRVAIDLASTTGIVAGQTSGVLWVNESSHLRSL